MVFKALPEHRDLMELLVAKAPLALAVKAQPELKAQPDQAHKAHKAQLEQAVKEL